VAGSEDTLGTPEALTMGAPNPHDDFLTLTPSGGTEPHYPRTSCPSKGYMHLPTRTGIPLLRFPSSKG